MRGKRPTADMGTHDHARSMHPRESTRRIIIAEKEGGWREWSFPVDDLSYAMKHFTGLNDVFLTFNEFNGKRRLVQKIAGLEALYIDIDYYKSDIHHLSPEAAVVAVTDALRDRGLPLPSLFLFTGRGLSVSWWLHTVPFIALPRWRAAQRRLWKVLEPFGADPMALDAARLVRLSGTTNSHTGQPVRVLDGGTGEMWDFDSLADEIFPLTRAQYRDDVAAKEKARADRQRLQLPRPATFLTQETLQVVRLMDLQKLRHLRWMGELPAGQRNAMMWVAAVAMGFIVPGQELPRELVRLGLEWAGWSPSETRSRTAAVVERVQRYMFGGGSKDDRYRLRNDTIIDILQIEDDEARRADLRCLAPPTVKRERERERQADIRRKAGAVERSEYEGSARQRRQEAIDRKAEGQSYRQISEAMGISHDHAKKLVKRGRQDGLAPSTIKVSETAETLPPKGGDKSVLVYGGIFPTDITLTKAGPTSSVQHQSRDAARQSPSAGKVRQAITERSWTPDFFWDPFADIAAVDHRGWQGGIMPLTCRRAVRVALDQLGMTQDDLAKRLSPDIEGGISRVHLSNVLNGNFGASKELAAAIWTFIEEVQLLWMNEPGSMTRRPLRAFNAGGGA